MGKRWNESRDLCHNLKLFFGFTFLGWHKPVGYEWGYFVDYHTVALKYRDTNRVIHTKLVSYSKDGVNYSE